MTAIVPEALPFPSALSRAQAGNHDAFAQLVEQHEAMVYSLAYHFFSDRGRAEEIAQDAFVRLYRNASNYREQEKLGPYLFRIATNLTVSEVRRAKRWTLLLPRLQSSTQASIPAPDAGVITDEIQREEPAQKPKAKAKAKAPAKSAAKAKSPAKPKGKKK